MRTDRLPRPEQLLEDDPSFLPDLVLAPLDFDLSTFEASLTGDSQLSLTLSPRTPGTSVSGALGGPVGGLVIPTSDTGGLGGDIGGFVVSGDDGLGTGRVLGEDDGFLPEADFAFDANGNLLDFSIAGAASHATVPVMGARVGAGDDTAVSARVRAEHTAGVRAGVSVCLHILSPILHVL